MKRQLSDASVAVLFRLERLQIELDSVAQQVTEIDAAVQARGGALRASAVLEGLAQLAGNLGKIEAQSDAASVDHIESGREEARALAGQIRASGRSLRERMERLRNGLNKGSSISSSINHGTSSSSSSSSINGDGAAAAMDESGPGITRQMAVDATLLQSPTLARMDTGASDASGGPLSNGGGNGDAVAALPSDTALYSWGRLDLGALFQQQEDDAGPHRNSKDGADECPALLAAARSAYSKRNFAALCTTLYHTVGVSTTGEVYGSGVNEEGQVAPERPEAQVAAPVLVEALLSQRVLQVACGDNHTACLTASGSVVTFGANEAGQLGHSQGAAAASRVGPRTMLGLGGKIVKQIACGSFFTLALSADGQVFSTGVGECGGHADGANRFQAERVEKLCFVPVAFLAAGASHVVAVSVTGQAWAWGQNRQGQAGVPDQEVVQEPTRVPGLPAAGIRSAACGGFHTLFLTLAGGEGAGGDVYACGKNHRGQLGLPPAMEAGAAEAEAATGSNCYRTPVLVPQLSGVGVCMLACGDAHTLALTREGKVLAMGANGCGQLGCGGRESGGRWRAEEVQGLEGARVFVVAAGGEQSFALGLGPSVPAFAPIGLGPPSHGSGNGVVGGVQNGGGGGGMIRRGPSTMLDEGTLDLIRKFSVIKPATSFVSAAALLATVEEAAAASITSTSNGSGGSSTEALERQLSDLFSSASLVNGSFLHPHTASGLDVLGLEAVYVAVMRLGNGAALLQRLVGAFNVGLDALLPSVKELGRAGGDADSLRCLLAYWQCPLNSNMALSKEPFLKLCDALVRLPADARDRLIGWARADYPPHIFATRLLRPLHRHLAYHLTLDFGKGRAVPTLALVMSFLFAANERTTGEGMVGKGRGDAGPLIPPDQFANEAVSSLPDESLLYDLRNWKTRRGENFFTFCAFPFLLSAEAKRRLLNSEAQLEQQQAAQQEVMRNLFQGGPVLPFFVLHVERARLLQSTLAQIGSVDSLALKKQLKVRFVGEEGVDEGGVKKEFFQLLIAQLFDPCYGMFKTTDSRRDLWFNPSCTWSGDEYGLVGVLVALAIYNAALLDLHFPRVVYKKLLDLPVGLPDLEDLEPELMTGLQTLLAYDEAAPENSGASVADVFCLTFEVDWVEFDEVKRHELKPGGKEVAVTAENREEYVELYVRWVLEGSIAKQFEDFKAGFNRVMGGTSIALLRPEELELLVCGTPHLNFHELEEVARYEGGYDAKHPVVRGFWETVHEMDLESQRKLLMFITGSYKAPIGGLGKLSVLIQRAGPDADSLPTSHTCFNALLLPEYASKAKLRERLMKAINECQGFGLQ